MEWISGAPDLLIPTSAVGAGIWLFYRLFLRSDRREQDAFREVKRQRDEWRARAEIAEDGLADCHQALARASLTIERHDEGYSGGPDRGGKRGRRGHRDADGGSRGGPAGD